MQRWPRQIVVKLIEIYQLTLSPDHSWVRHLVGGCYCKFRPSCSEYSRQAVDKYGVLAGGLKGVKRIVRCRPGVKGGWDELK
ncbi:membrane protein insertion efficiency factor YidD [Candidatus Peregrinibacteria bacterium CG11_big_fil_rev_8_21_14_0_20_41_10]|nr:MAG: membrane protein insertion efficiency factor YidD [Candidatus Peregrinibacteria bacterium CG11_big_fil_rev_8_21_14_0_20_41_10]PIZ76004.1 MAG: membrane protein insertion efficiency factor YidD [Candidatus Peregrinibacteria bacterium CG_4_10_14_0_2_um_filter_41_8]PJC37775.1 MAG: membrane protein insertion efficiency factor YidD [Candidatus Peregrinibacteria bacterium CG_4_9_14_0_2_um_filter_41_14]